jgi:hypothetical protein
MVGGTAPAKLMQDLKRRWKEQRQKRRDLERRLVNQHYETSENGCRIEFPVVAKERRRSYCPYGAHYERVIKSINPTIGREAIVEWTRPQAMIEQLKIDGVPASDLVVVLVCVPCGS